MRLLHPRLVHLRLGPARPLREQQVPGHRLRVLQVLALVRVLQVLVLAQAPVLGQERELAPWRSLQPELG